MRIVVDAFGGDNAPPAAIQGAADARDELGANIVLTGQKTVIEKTAADMKLDLGGIEIVDAPQVVDMHDEAKAVVKSKKDSSMAVGLRMVADDEADAFVSAGSTGALLMGATLVVKRLEGVKRPALATVLPTAEGPCLLIDCGANVECRPEMLDQFGAMGSIYMTKTLGIDSPRVALANNGTEESKGTELQIEAYKLLKQNAAVNFIGNAEGRDIPTGYCDVAVCDGFTGNIILKTYEGLAEALMRMLKDEVFMKNLGSKLATKMFLMGGLRDFRKRMDYTEYGGAPFIGLKKPVIKAHGSSNAKAIKNAIRQAMVWSGAGVTEAIAEAVGPKAE